MSDIRLKIREAKAPLALTIVLDNSYSMKTEILVEKVREGLLELLSDVKFHRDKVALVAFEPAQAIKAQVYLPLSSSYRFAARMLRKIPISTRTPLADGVAKGYRLLRQEMFKHKNAIPLLMIITDGLPNVSFVPRGDPYADVYSVCRQVRASQIPTVVLDIEPPAKSKLKRCIDEMVDLTGAAHFRWADLTVSPFKAVTETAMPARRGAAPG